MSLAMPQLTNTWLPRDQVEKMKRSSHKKGLTGKLGQLKPPPRLSSPGRRPRSRALATFTLTLAASVIAVVACGPTREEVMMEPRPRPLKVFNDCASTIARGHFKNIGFNDKQKLSVRFCQASPEDGGEIKSLEHPVRFRLANRNGDLAVHLRVGVILPEGIQGKAISETEKRLGECKTKIEQIWRKSKLGVGLDLKFPTSQEKLEQGIDQELVLAIDDKAHSREFPSFRMTLWPEQGRLFPLHYRTSDVVTCAKNHRGQPQELESCYGKARESAAAESDLFCAHVAVLVGHWLGLPAQGSEAGICLAGPSDGGSGASANVDERTTFMQSAATLQGMPPADSTKFWKEARFAISDLKTILAPACPSVATSTKNKASSLAKK
jgi:hypothetical protein